MTTKLKAFLTLLLALLAGLGAGTCVTLANGSSVRPGFEQRFAAFAIDNPPWYEPGKAPETTEQRAARVRLIVRAVVAETADQGRWPKAWGHRDRAAAVFVKLWNESTHLKLEVHDGRERGDKGKAICLGQVHRNGMTTTEWSALAGTDEAATRRCVRTVERYIVAHLWRCGRGGHSKTALARAFVGYGTGGPCETEGRGWATERASMWARLRFAQ